MYVGFDATQNTGQKTSKFVQVIEFAILKAGSNHVRIEDRYPLRGGPSAENGRRKVRKPPWAQLEDRGLPEGRKTEPGRHTDGLR